MALTYEFEINGIPIEEPLNFSSFSIGIKRDPDSHGVIFEASLGELGFYGAAADLLAELKRVYGFEAKAKLAIKAFCGEEVDLIEGNLLFPKYRKVCGTQCIVYMPLEQNDCTLTIRNRFDTKVDMDKSTGFDGITGLPEYAGLTFPLHLTAQAIDARVEGFVDDEGEVINYQSVYPGDLGLVEVDIRPDYKKVIFDSIDSAQLTPSVQVAESITYDNNVSPFILFDDNPACYRGQFNWGFRFKGRFSINHNLSDMAAKIRISTWDGVGTWESNRIAIIPDDQFYSSDAYVANTVVEFDITKSGLLSLAEGTGIYAVLTLGDGADAPNEPTFHVEFDPETTGYLYQTKLCPDTQADVSLVNEAGSRIVEAITDGCVRLKSDYYGRVDSEPYASATDGCGSLRVLTSGLKLRNAENPTHFLSMSEFIQGLRGIDNIGWGVEEDEERGPGFQWVRLEPMEYFYQDKMIMEMPAIPEGAEEEDASLAYNQVLIGYQKWETQRINGLNEFNSNKVFRTGLTSINNPLEAVSGFVAGGQPIEVTRQQSFADTGAADTSYDNDTFIICVDRTEYPYTDPFVVETGNIGNPSGIFSPDTVYNWRIRPRHNLMRWWKSIMQSYANLINSTSKLYFANGTGNLLASGFLDDDCRLDSVDRREDEDLVKTDFLVQESPIFRPTKLNFSYTLSLREFLLIRANPYGYINAQCGNGEFQKGFISSITYNLNAGTADISLLLKYE